MSLVQLTLKTCDARLWFVVTRPSCGSGGRGRCGVMEPNTDFFSQSFTALQLGKHKLRFNSTDEESKSHPSSSTRPPPGHTRVPPSAFIWEQILFPPYYGSRRHQSPSHWITEMTGRKRSVRPPPPPPTTTQAP